MELKLKYVRTKIFDGMGDLGRMQRQQQFMSSVLRKATVRAFYSTQSNS